MIFYNSPYPEKYMGNNTQKQCIYNLLGKLKSHQEFCANNKVTIIFDNGKEYTFSIYKGRELYINNASATSITEDELAYIVKNCPVTGFVSHSTQSLYDYAMSFINDGKRIALFRGLYSGGEDTSGGYEWNDNDGYNYHKHYVYITSVKLVDNQVILFYTEFALNDDNMEFIKHGYHSCVLNNHWRTDDLIDKKELEMKVEERIKTSIFEYTKQALESLTCVTSSIENL